MDYSDMSESMLEKAIQYTKSGHYQVAEPILAKFLQENPTSEKAWICLAICVNGKRQIECLKKVVDINPNNTRAKQLLLKYESAELELSTSPSINNSMPLQKITSQQNISIPLKKDTKTNQGDRENNEEILPQAFVDDFQEPPISDNDEEEIDDNDYDIDLSKYEPYNAPIFEYREGSDVIERDITGIFGRSILVDGFSFKPYNKPACLFFDYEKNFNSETCEECDYFLPSDCLLKFDNDLIDEIKSFLLLEQKQYDNQSYKSQNAAQTIYYELKHHGRPLHYSVLAKIIQDRYPSLKMTGKAIYQIIRWHPDLFVRVESGVYQAR